MLTTKVDAVHSLNHDEQIDWTADLRQASNACIAAIARFAQNLQLALSQNFVLQINAEVVELYYTAEHRQSIVLSQALTVLTAAVAHQYWTAHKNKTQNRNKLLLCLNSYLSCYRSERGMLEDVLSAVHYAAKSAEFRFAKCFSSVSTHITPLLEYSVKQRKLLITIPILEELLPKECSVRIEPLLFSVGINEDATMAEKLGDIRLEAQINAESVQQLRRFFEEVKAAQSANENRLQLMLVEQLLKELENEVLSAPRAKQYKNVTILHLVSQICRQLSGVQIIFCKSGKDRTSMAVTLEEAYCLMRHYELRESDLQKTINALRLNGTRRANVKKNAGLDFYAFSAITIKFLPELYRPPGGSFSKNAET